MKRYLLIAKFFLLLTQICLPFYIQGFYKSRQLSIHGVGPGVVIIFNIIFICFKGKMFPDMFSIAVIFLLFVASVIPANSRFYKLTLILPNLWIWMCPVCPFPFRESTSGTQKHCCNLTQRGLVDEASWISQVPMKATWLPLNTLFHAPNTVQVSKIAHVFLIGFCFHDTQANIKGIPLSSWCFIWIPGCLPSLMFSGDWESIGPSASPEVLLPSGLRKLGHV